MSARITGKGPDCVGDLPSMAIVYTPPAAAPSATPSAVTVTARKPDGTTIAATPATGSGLEWTWTAATPIDLAGLWYWRVTATGDLTDASEFGVDIPKSPFT